MHLVSQNSSLILPAAANCQTLQALDEKPCFIWTHFNRSAIRNVRALGRNVLSGHNAHVASGARGETLACCVDFVSEIISRSHARNLQNTYYSNQLHHRNPWGRNINVLFVSCFLCTRFWLVGWDLCLRSLKQTRERVLQAKRFLKNEKKNHKSQIILNSCTERWGGQAFGQGATKARRYVRIDQIYQRLNVSELWRRILFGGQMSHLQIRTKWNLFTCFMWKKNKNTCDLHAECSSFLSSSNQTSGDFLPNIFRQKCTCETSCL